MKAWEVVSHVHSIIECQQVLYEAEDFDYGLVSIVSISATPGSMRAAPIISTSVI